MRTNTVKGLGQLMAAMVCCAAVTPVQAGFEVADKNGRIEIRDGGNVVFGWQHETLKEPKGGEKFACSAFVHPLCTPSGFDLTEVQPGDHLHHLGVWWPWKIISVKGEKHVTWEMQQGQGRQIAVGAKVKSQSADVVVLEAENRHEIKPKDGDYVPVVKELTTLRFARMGDHAYVLDITIRHSPIGSEAIEISKYRYSGFSWRGTPVWNKDNSVMRTSGGHDRQNANGQEANWVTVDGETKAGRATMLMMSAAPKNGGTSERLRVWNASAHNGAPFVNFNPVVKESIVMTPERKEVALRRYRLVMADHAIASAEAEKLWKAWK